MCLIRQVIVQGSPSAIGRLQVQQQQQQGAQQAAAAVLPQVVSAAGGAIPDRASSVVAQANANNATMVVASPAQPTVVSVANLTPGQLQAAQKIVSQSGGIQRTLVSANTGKPLTQQQIMQFKQQAILKKQQEQAAARARQQQQQLPQQQATVVATTSTGQKVSVAVTPSGQLAAITSAAGVSAVTVVTTQAGAIAGQQAKAHLIRQLNAPVGAAGGVKTSTANVRSMTEGEMKLILARQQQQQQQGQQQGQQAQQGSAQHAGAAAKAQIASIQVPAGGQPMSAAAQQLLQAGIQIQTTAGGTPVAALVKAAGSQQQAQQQSQQQSVTIPLQGMNVNAVRAAAIRGGQVATASPQQLTIIHRQLLQQKRQQQQQQAAAAAAVAAGGSVVQQLPQGAKGTLGSVVAAASKSGGGTQLIVSGAAAGGPNQLTQKVTVQQIQQLVKQAQQQQQQQQPGGGGLQQQQLQGIPQAVLKQAAAAGQAGTVQARVIPVSSAGGGRGPQIQVRNHTASIVFLN